MKIKNKKLAIIAAAILAVFLILFIIFHARSPVLIVTDLAFIPLYGAQRIRSETLRSSLILFRPVKTVIVADDAGNDIIRIAISDTSSRPYCVIFPLRFAPSARLYREQNPGIPVVLLGSRYSEDTVLSAVGGDASDYFIFTTDIDAEFYRAGMIAAALDRDKDGKIFVFVESHIQTQAREAFLRAINSHEKPLETFFFTSYSRVPDYPDLSCVILAGTGAEYMERDSGVPVIFFTWIDPALLPRDIVVVINDSPWVQAVQAVRMVSGRVSNGLIKSEFKFINGKNIDRRTLRKMQKQG